MKIAILGNGGFGTAMALVLQRANHTVALWGHDPVYTAEIAATRGNPRYLDGITLSDAIRITSDAISSLQRLTPKPAHISVLPFIFEGR